jgi:membrane-bound ClpP family serine protease
MPWTLCYIKAARCLTPSEENMTSEEMNRAIEFIIQHQAQLAIEMEDLAKLHKRDHDLLAQLVTQGQRISELIVIESGRVDRSEKENRDIHALLEIQQQRLDRAEREDQAAQKRHEQLMQELRDRLDRIFDKLS